MAVYAKVTGARPVQNGGAVGFAPQDKATQGVVQQGTTEDLSVSNAYEVLLDGRYKVGGSTTWERPAAPGA